jgi:hypothetical protein
MALNGVGQPAAGAAWVAGALLLMLFVLSAAGGVRAAEGDQVGLWCALEHAHAPAGDSASRHCAQSSNRCELFLRQLAALLRPAAPPLVESHWLMLMLPAHMQHLLHPVAADPWACAGAARRG